jgi:hypothetical protein
LEGKKGNLAREGRCFAALSLLCRAVKPWVTNGGTQ